MARFDYHSYYSSNPNYVRSQVIISAERIDEAISWLRRTSLKGHYVIDCSMRRDDSNDWFSQGSLKELRLTIKRGYNIKRCRFKFTNEETGLMFKLNFG